jgi:spermidine/putrescine transport system ATP-binding protein
VHRSTRLGYLVDPRVVGRPQQVAQGARRTSANVGGMTQGDVQLLDLEKRFDDTVAIEDVTLEVQGGEFFSLLGPSGCGKTTTLRLIGGFDIPTSGRILLEGQDVIGIPPNKRNVNTVFQNYALFPHLSVFDNVAFGLRYKSLSKGDARRQVHDVLSLVQLEGFGKRRPSQLSGGQQQRVALARALVLNPKVLLLDEPLGALDAKLRKALQLELKTLQKEVGITFIYVTHDQEEALTMSDRLAVMSRGHVEQIGSPQEIYEEPHTSFVADFLGVSNLMDADVAGATSAGRLRVRLGDGELIAEGDDNASGRVRVSIRPERIELESREPTGQNRVAATVERVVYVGSTIQVFLTLALGPRIQAWVPNRGGEFPFSEGTRLSAHLPPTALRVLRGEQQ